MMNVDREIVAAAFARWENEYRENPGEFMTEEARLALATASYGERCAIWLDHYIGEVLRERLTKLYAGPEGASAPPRLLESLPCAHCGAPIVHVCAAGARADADELLAFAHDVAAAGKPGTCRDCFGSLPTPFVYCPSGSGGSACRRMTEREESEYRGSEQQRRDLAGENE